MKLTDIAEGETIEHASNEAFHAFAERAFTSVKNTKVEDWQDRYLRWVAVNRMLESGRVIRQEKEASTGWKLIILSEQKSEEKSCESDLIVEEKTSDVSTEAPYAS